MAMIGIDLGTTNSLAAYFKDGAPVIIPNVYGDPLTPSVVSVDEQTEEVYVGRVAKERLLTHPALTAAVFKRSMGSKKSYRLGAKRFMPEELSSLVIRKLREDAEAYLGEPVNEAIISVPAYFNDAQRRATKTAGALAGLKVERIVNEPTAAAVAYGLHDEKDHTKYMVFDLGGGTFDISILEKYENIMEVRAVAGDNFLGGEDFTEILVQMFVKHHQLDWEALSLMAQAGLRKCAETAKRAFSETRTVEMSFNLQGETLTYAVPADEFDKNCEPLFTRLRNPIKRALSDASIRLAEVDAVLLVGGATRLPSIRVFVSKLLGRFPASGINPDEAVALGAAVQAALKSRVFSEVVLTDVCPYTLGTSISVYKPNGFYESGHFCPIIERNTVIPVSRSERLYTVHDQQRVINIEILQGESRRAAENVQLGELNIAIPQDKAGKECVDVRYTYDINGILEVEVTVVSTQVKKCLVIEKNPGMMSAEEIAARLESLSALKIHPRERDEYRYLLARGERMYEESVGETRQFLAHVLQVFEGALDRQDDREIRGQAKQLKEALDEIEGNREY